MHNKKFNNPNPNPHFEARQQNIYDFFYKVYVCSIVVEYVYPEYNVRQARAYARIQLFFDYVFTLLYTCIMYIQYEETILTL